MRCQAADISNKKLQVYNIRVKNQVEPGQCVLDYRDFQTVGMKKIVLMAVISAFICFYLSAVYFDSYNYEKYLGFIMPDCQVNLSVYRGKGKEIREEDLMEGLKKCAANHRLNLFQVHSANDKDSADLDLLTFAFIGDETCDYRLRLDNGEFADFHNLEYYATNERDPAHRIFTTFGEDRYGIRSMDEKAFHYGFTAFGEYYLTSNDRTSLFQQASLFAEEIKEEFGDSVIIDFNYIERTESADFRTFFFRQNYHTIVVLMLIILVNSIVLNAETINRQKEISILKLEGYSTAEIFRKEVLKEYGLHFGGFIVTEAVFSLYFMKLLFKENAIFWGSLAQVTALYFAAVFLFGVFTLAIVKMVPVNLSMKGKQFNGHLKILLICMKIICLVILMDSVQYGVTSLYQFTVNAADYSSRMNAYKYLYAFKSARLDTVSEQGGMMTSPTPEEVFNVLQKENGLSWFQYLAEINGHHVYQTDENYLKQYLPDIDILPGEWKCYVLFPESMKDETYNREIAEKVMMTVFPDNPGDILEICSYGKLPNYDYYMIGSSSSVRSVSLTDCTDILVAVTSPYSFNELVSNMFFRYQGDTDEAIGYVDRLWMDSTGRKSPWNIEDVQSLYHRFYESKSKHYLKNIAVFVLYLFSYILLCSQIVKEDFLQNRQLYFAEKTEGITWGSFLHKYLLNSVIIVLAASVFKMMISDTYRLDTVITYLFISAVEIPASMFIYYRRFIRNRTEDPR